jgi:hypothetical protein
VTPPAAIRPGDAMLRADRVVYALAGSWKHGLFINYLALKQLIAAEIAAAVNAERLQCDREMAAVLDASERLARASHRALDHADAVKAELESSLP